MSGLFGNIFRRLFWTTSFKSTRECPVPSNTPPIEHEGGYKIYKRISLLVALPAILVLAAMIYVKKKTCEEEREPFVKYEYLRLHSKRFPWGDGTRSLFHNPRVNPLQDGYEDEEKGEEEC